jgi:hypothetical protein
MRTLFPRATVLEALHGIKNFQILKPFQALKIFLALTKFEKQEERRRLRRRERFGEPHSTAFIDLRDTPLQRTLPECSKTLELRSGKSKKL